MQDTSSYLLIMRKELWRRKRQRQTKVFFHERWWKGVGPCVRCLGAIPTKVSVVSPDMALQARNLACVTSTRFLIPVDTGTEVRDNHKLFDDNYVSDFKCLLWVALLLLLCLTNSTHSCVYHHSLAIQFDFSP
jgi:hypothetical protein